MKMIRRLIIILCIVLFSLGIAGCSSCDNKEEPDPQAGYVQTITLKNEQLIVGLYMSDTIEYQGEGEATYNSDNPEIVSVDETGKITGLKVGKANVTVAIGEAKAVCEVTVVDTNETPYIKLAISDSEYNLLVEDYIQLNAKLIFAQEERAETITYESSSDSVVVDENGKLTAKKVGTATITVSANFFDKTITKLLKINVLNSPVVLNATTSNYVVYTNASKGNNDSVTLPNSVIEDEQIKNVDFTYEYDQSKLVNVDNVFKAKLPCVKDETVDVKMTYTDSEQKTYTFTIEVEIKLVNEDLEGKTTLILENGSSRAITDRGITLVYNEIDIPEEIVAVYENGIDLQYNKQTNEVQSPMDTAGSSKWDLIAESGIVYNVPVEFYDIVLYDGDDFKNFLPKAANKYVVLANDIEKVENYPQKFNSFTGTLDGRGYSVEEITFGRHPEWGIFGSLFYQFAGTVKNISFDEMKLLNTQSGIAAAAVGNATLENVFINATTDAAKSSSALFDDAYGEYKINLTNVVVIFNGVGAGTPYAIIGDGEENNAMHARTVNCTNVYVSGVKSDNTAVAFSPDDSAITGCVYKTDAELYQLARSGEFATELLNNKVLANVYNTVDKTETQIYYVENWTRTDVALTNDHSAKFIANADLSDEGSTTIEKITSNGIDLGYNSQTGTLDASKLTAGTSIWNIHYANNEIYKVTVHVADAIIRNATDFKEILPNATNEYIMLANNIEKVENYPHKYSTFTGTLDGCGYSIGEITYSRHPEYYTGGWLFYTFNGTIKNISFSKMTVLGNSVIDNRQSGIAFQVGNGSALLENVFINATSTTTAQANAMFGDAWGDAYITLRNVVVIANCTGAGGTLYSILGNDKSYTITSASNVYVSGVKADSSATPMSPSGNIVGCTYKTETELLQMANDNDATLTLMAKNAIKNALG